jgi:hypothetical protein
MSTATKAPPPDQSAFPIPHDDRTGAYQAEPGMGLRDYFAAKALQALITRGMSEHHLKGPAGVPVITRFAYEYADAMLAARLHEPTT